MGTGTLTSQYQTSNLLGQVTRQWGSQTNPVQFTYDGAGNRATLTTYQAAVTNVETFPSGNGNLTTWTYDPSGVLLSKRDAADQQVNYTYDIAGRVLTRTWARGVVTSYGYTAGQLTSVQYTNDPTNTPTVSITYDRLGRPVRRANIPLAETLYAYDATTLALDTETISIDPDGSGALPSLTRVLNRSRDPLGRESGTAVSAVGSGSPEHFLTYGYDNSGRLSSVASPAGTFTTAYTPNSSLIASVIGPVHTVTNTWEPNRDVLDIKENRIPSTTPPISSFNYGVNAIGQRTGVETTGLAFDTAPADWVWGYDALGQVITADSPTAGFDRAYLYDQIGNRKKATDGALVTTGSATIYEPNPLNQYSEIQNQQSGIVNPVHDADGNATFYPLPVDPTTNAVLTYDRENRLISVITGTTTVSYIYDSQSRRIARTEDTNTTVYLYDAWNCLGEYTLHNSSFILHTSLSWGLDLSGSLQGAGGVGGLLAVSKHQGQSATHFYPTYDGNGNVSEYLTASGTIAAHYEYDPFGRTIVASGENAGDFEYRFSTKPRDAATGLSYYGYRWYDPNTGRWQSRDPIEESGGMNLYGFVGNASVTKMDLYGLAELKGSLLLEWTTHVPKVNMRTNMLEGYETAKHYATLTWDTRYECVQLYKNEPPSIVWDNFNLHMGLGGHDLTTTFESFLVASVSAGPAKLTMGLGRKIVAELKSEKSQESIVQSEYGRRRLSIRTYKVRMVDVLGGDLSFSMKQGSASTTLSKTALSLEFPKSKDSEKELVILAQCGCFDPPTGPHPGKYNDLRVFSPSE